MAHSVIYRKFIKKIVMFIDVIQYHPGTKYQFNISLTIEKLCTKFPLKSVPMTAGKKQNNIAKHAVEMF